MVNKNTRLIQIVGEPHKNSPGCVSRGKKEEEEVEHPASHPEMADRCCHLTDNIKLECPLKAGALWLICNIKILVPSLSLYCKPSKRITSKQIAEETAGRFGEGKQPIELSL